MSAVNEKCIALEIHRGNREAVADLVAAYKDRLFTYTFHMLGGSDDALDVTQEAFVKAYVTLTGKYDAERCMTLEIRPWLYRIVRNLALNRLRSRKRMAGAVDKMKEEVQSFVPRNDMARSIRSALDKLGRESRELIIPAIHRAILLRGNRDGHRLVGIRRCGAKCTGRCADFEKSWRTAPVDCNESTQNLNQIRTGEADEEASRSVAEQLAASADSPEEAAFMKSLAVASPKLKMTAPAGIEEEVMIRIADRYDVIDTDFGPAHVGFTPRGISAVKLDVEEDGAFESYYKDRLGRIVVRGFPAGSLCPGQSEVP